MLQDAIKLIIFDPTLNDKDSLHNLQNAFHNVQIDLQISAQTISVISPLMYNQMCFLFLYYNKLQQALEADGYPKLPAASFSNTGAIEKTFVSNSGYMVLVTGRK